MTNTIYSKEYREIAKKLVIARKQANLTQEEVAKKLDKPQSYISKVEAGQQRTDVIELSQFSKLYNKSLNYFVK